MLVKYGEDINLCFTDTDSLLYEVRTKDIYEDMKSDIDRYDFSEYPFEHSLYSRVNKKTIGKFKDELNSMTLLEFVGLRPKSYSLEYCGFVKDNVLVDIYLHQSQKSKGTKEAVKKAHLRHCHFVECWDGLKTFVVRQNVIKSRSHIVSTYHMNKVALTAFDTKRWILEDNVHTLAYGHFKTL